MTKFFSLGVILCVLVLLIGNLVNYVRLSQDQKKDQIPLLQRLTPPRDEPFEVLLNLTTKMPGRWQMWDRMSPLVDDGAVCELTPVHPRWNRTAKARICTYPTIQDIWVSKTIKESGRWPDCDELVDMWDKSNKNVSNQAVYLEIGANIGSCIMEMLLSTDAKIVAFEPDPRNLAQLTTTLMVNDINYRNRVALFPLGLASESGTSTISTHDTNRGSAIVGKAVKEQGYLDPVAIPIEMLDTIFSGVNLKSLTIPAIKMDVEGFECHVVDGGKNVFRRAKSIKTEVADEALVAQGCSGSGLLNRLREINFTIMPERPGKDIIGYKTVQE